MARSPLQHAQHLAAAGRIAEAERACREALATRPNDPQALRLRAQLARHPDNPAPNPAESVRIFQQLRQARPGDLQLAGELGASLTAAGQAAQAYPLLKQAVTAMPSNPAWHLWLGRCLLRLFKPQAAIAALREARRLDPGSTDALLPLAGALIQSAQPERAEPVVREYLATHPGSLPARTTLAEVFEHRGRLDDAIAECRTVLEKHPAHGGTLGILARCLHAKGLTDEAARALEPLVSGPDLSPSGVIALAPIYLAQKRSAECRDLCERALRTDALATPLRSSLLSVLALARQNLGEFDAAFEAFAEAKACLPRTFNRERHAARYDAIRAAFPPERTAAGSAARGGRCVFIVGMPRTGTTLLEQRGPGAGHAHDEHAPAAASGRTGRGALGRERGADRVVPGGVALAVERAGEAGLGLGERLERRVELAQVLAGEGEHREQARAQGRREGVGAQRPLAQVAALGGPLLGQVDRGQGDHAAGREIGARDEGLERAGRLIGQALGVEAAGQDAERPPVRRVLLQHRAALGDRVVEAPAVLEDLRQSRAGGERAGVRGEVLAHHRLGPLGLRRLDQSPREGQQRVGAPGVQPARLAQGRDRRLGLEQTQQAPSQPEMPCGVARHRRDGLLEERVGLGGLARGREARAQLAGELEVARPRLAELLEDPHALGRVGGGVVGVAGELGAQAQGLRVVRACGQRLAAGALGLGDPPRGGEVLGVLERRAGHAGSLGFGGVQGTPGLWLGNGPGWMSVA